MRLLLALTVLGMAIFSGWSLFAGDAPLSTESSAVSPPAAPQELPPQSDDGPIGRSVESVPFEEPEVIPAKESPTANIQAEAKTRELEIRVVVIDDRGQPHHQETGSLSFRAFINGSSKSIASLPINTGRARMRIQDPCKISFTKGELGGRKIQLTHRLHEPPKSGPWEIKVQWFYPFVLRVEDAQTKLNLSGIEIRRIQDYRLDSMQHPGTPLTGKIVVSNAASPLALSEGLSLDGTENILWIGAPGYAWTHTKTLHTGADGLVRLERGGDLRIRVSGEKPPKGSVIRIRTKEGIPIAEAKLPKDQVRSVERLKPGAYEVLVEFGDWFDDPIVLARASVEIVAGRTAQTDVIVGESFKKPEATKVSGILRVDPIWHDNLSFSLGALGKTSSWAKKRIYLKSAQLKQVPGTKGDFSFTIDRMIPGSWQIIVEPMRYRERLEIEPARAHDLLIEVPAPASVSLRVIDAKTGTALAAPARVSWHAKAPLGVSMSRHKSATYNKALDAYTFTAATGTVSVSVGSKGFQGESKEVTLIPGDNQLEVFIARSCGILVAARWQGKAIPVNWDWTLKLVSVTGIGNSRDESPRDGTFFIAVSEPGKYKLTVDPVDAYATPAPIEITIPAETIVPITIDVESKQ